MDLIERRTNFVNQCCREISEAILKDEELTEIATRITSLGWHQLNLGHDMNNRQMMELGEHFHKLGGDLQNIALLRIRRSGL